MMSRGNQASGQNTNAILYGDVEPRTPSDGSGQVIVDGFTYLSAVPRPVPSGHDAESVVKRLIVQWPVVASDRTQALHYLLCVLGNGHDWNDDGQLVSPYEEDPDYWKRSHVDRPLLEDPDELYLFLVRSEEKERRQYEEAKAQRSPEQRQRDQEASDKLFADIKKALKDRRAEIGKTGEQLFAADPDDDPGETMSDFRERQLRERAAEDADLYRRTREDANVLAQTTPPLEHPYPLSQGCSLVDFPEQISDDWLAAVIETATMIKDTPIDAYRRSGYTPEQTQRDYDNNQRHAEDALARALELQKQRSS